MGHVQATSPFFQVPFVQGLTRVSSGALYKIFISKSPVEKRGKFKVSGGLRKTGDFKGLRNCGKRGGERVLQRGSFVPDIRESDPKTAVGGTLLPNHQIVDVCPGDTNTPAFLNKKEERILSFPTDRPGRERTGSSGVPARASARRARARQRRSARCSPG